MWSPRRKGAAAVTVIALLAFAGLAAAEELPTEEPEEEPTQEAGNTVFNFGYDEESQLFVWNTSDSDGAPTAAEVAGPNGQINHGMFVKLFNSLYEGAGRGCLNRYLAQSELGRGDQQIKVGDVDPDREPVTDGDTGEIDFSTFAADCERGNDADGNGNGNGNGSGDDDGSDPDETSSQGGRPDSPGKSGDAPGRNK